MSVYIESELTLDSLDLISIQSLIEARIKELEDLKVEHDNAWFIVQMADEQIHNYNSTLTKIKSARENVKRIKAEADAAYHASRKV